MDHILGKLEYNYLLRYEIIPKLSFKNFSLKRLPKWCNSNLEIADLYLKFKLHKHLNGELHYDNFPPYEQEEIKSGNEFKVIAARTKTNPIDKQNIKFNYDTLDSNFQIYKKIDVHNFSFFPEILSENTILISKTITNPNKNYKQDLLELFAYICLLQKPITKIGIFYLLQNDYISFDISSYSFQKLNIYIRNHLKWVNWSEKELSINKEIFDKVGETLCYCDNLYNKLKTYLERTGNKPVQVTLPINDGSIIEKNKEIREYIMEKEMKVYVHSPYYINLCKGLGTFSLKTQLRNAYLIGGKGVVVHVGKYSNKVDIHDELITMKNNILQVLNSTTKDCPLLLETPAGQGNESLVNIEEFVSFYENIKDERFKICVDTCHVFAAGYDPLEYLMRWCKKFDPNTIGLVHMNDSKHKRYSRKDRHEIVGKGYIGDRLYAVVDFCVNHGIDMVMEY
jgi:deoxyribonuclease-4